MLKIPGAGSLKEAYVNTVVFKSKPGTELVQQITDGYGGGDDRLSAWLYLTSLVDRAALSGDDSSYVKYDDSVVHEDLLNASSNTTAINVIVL